MSLKELLNHIDTLPLSPEQKTKLKNEVKELVDSTYKAGIANGYN